MQTVDIPIPIRDLQLKSREAMILDARCTTAQKNRPLELFLNKEHANLCTAGRHYKRELTVMYPDYYLLFTNSPRTLYKEFQ